MNREKKRLVRIDPLNSSIITAIFYGICSFLIVFSNLVIVLFNPPKDFIKHVVYTLVTYPLLYVLIGFIAGFVGATLYNLIAKWTGGLKLEFDSDDIPPVATSIPQNQEQTNQ